MTNTVRRNKVWLIAFSAILMAAGAFLGLQHIYAQSNPVEAPPPPELAQPGAPAGVPGVPGATDPAAGGGAASTAAVPTEPDMSFGQAVRGGVAVSSKKAWDGRVFSSLKFKYKTVDGRTLTVVLPAEYKSEKKTRAGWETLFVVYAMDVEIALDALERNRPPDVSAFMGQLMAEIRGQSGNRPAPDIISEAMEKAKAYLPAMGMGNISMPPALPGMP